MSACWLSCDVVVVVVVVRCVSRRLSTGPYKGALYSSVSREKEIRVYRECNAHVGTHTHTRARVKTLMTCFVDHSGLILYIGACVSLAGYIVSVLLRSHVLLNIQLGLLLSLATYALMVHFFPTVWDDRFTSLLGTIIVVTIAYNCAAAIVANMALAFVSLTLLAPFVHHCNVVISAFFVAHGWATVPDWVGTLVMMLLVAIFLVVLYLSRILDLLFAVVRIVSTSACVAFFAHLAWIEWYVWQARSDGALDYEWGDASDGGVVTSGVRLCCGNATDQVPGVDPTDTCPLALDNVLVDLAFILLAALATSLHFYTPCCTRRRDSSPCAARAADAPESFWCAKLTSARTACARAWERARACRMASSPISAPPPPPAALTRYEQIAIVRASMRR